jgi:hypothetical protein
MPKATAEKPLFNVSVPQRNVFQITMDYQQRADWVCEFLVSADRHWDNPHSNWKLQQQHLREAEARNAGVIDLGDFFCCMQGKYDNRSCKSDVRPEHNTSTYLDDIIKTATEFFTPWANRIIVIAKGNHETAIQKRHETDMTQRICDSLSMVPGAKVHNGLFSGWVVFKFRRSNTGNKRLSGTQTVNLHYDHGYGGGGPVTRGVIQTNRRAVYLPDAHIVASGHIHEGWMVETTRLRLNGAGKTSHDRQLHICVPTYKEEYGDGGSGWHAERGAPPKPVGAVWLRFWWSNKAERILWEATLAQ